MLRDRQHPLRLAEPGGRSGRESFCCDSNSPTSRQRLGLVPHIKWARSAALVGGVPSGGVSAALWAATADEIKQEIHLRNDQGSTTRSRFRGTQSTHCGLSAF